MSDEIIYMYQNTSSNSSNWTSSFPIETVNRTPVFAAMGLFSVLIISLNIMLILLISTNSTLREQMFYKYILSFCSCALAVGLIVLPLGMTSLIEKSWIHGEGVCKFWISVDYLSFSVLSLSTVVLMIDRLLMKFKPTLMFDSKGKWIRLSLILIPWSLPLIIGLPLLLQSTIHMDYATGAYCMVIYTDHVLAGLALLHMTPMLLLIFVNICTCFSFRKYGIPWQRMGETESTSGNTEEQEKLKITIVASCVVGFLTALLWLPFVTMFAVYWLCGFPKCVFSYTSIVAVYMTSMTSFFIPTILWIAILPELRHRVKSISSGIRQKFGSYITRTSFLSARDTTDTDGLYKVAYKAEN